MIPAPGQTGPNKTFIEGVVVLYLALTFALVVVDATEVYLSASRTDKHRRPYVWMTGIFDCFLRFVNLLFIVWWAVSMYKDNCRGMEYSLMGITVRIMGVGLGAIYEIAKNLIVKPPYLGSYWLRRKLHQEQAPVVTIFTLANTAILLFIETAIIGQMEVYQMVTRMRGAQTRPVTSEEAGQVPDDQAEGSTPQPPAAPSDPTDSTTAPTGGPVVPAQNASQAAPPGTTVVLMVTTQPHEATGTQHPSTSQPFVPVAVSTRPVPTTATTKRPPTSTNV